VLYTTREKLLQHLVQNDDYVDVVNWGMMCPIPSLVNLDQDFGLAFFAC